MIYNDGFQMNKNDQVVICPKCKNEEFSSKSEFCRICGTRVYNKCEGDWDDRDQYLIQHNCPGNARFCESCGKPTYFLTENYLKPWDQVQFIDNDENFYATDEVAATNNEFEISNSAPDDEDLPF
ncbi:hypothetical protein [Dehalobacter sp.]|uniref:hypothetical protein n=1 Tax=Dehalobacter sp. TaxID=1962289 RepID=UPI0025893411|nr:hypothetical protein [Dehalobacter sp.]MDJ0304747.1 hypothetical protein [Dehalobacter sp.]